MERFFVEAIHIGDDSEIPFAPIFAQLRLQEGDGTFGADFGDDIEEGLTDNGSLHNLFVLPSLIEYKIIHP